MWATALSLQCDGWSYRKEAIINMINTTPTPVFYKTSTTVQTRIEPKKLMAVVTDSASAMINGKKHYSYKLWAVSVCVCDAFTPSTN